MRISEYIFVTGSAHQDAYYNPFSLLFPPPPLLSLPNPPGQLGCVYSF